MASKVPGGKGKPVADKPVASNVDKAKPVIPAAAVAAPAVPLAQPTASVKPPATKPQPALPVAVAKVPTAKPVAPKSPAAKAAPVAKPAAPVAPVPAALAAPAGKPTAPLIATPASPALPAALVSTPIAAAAAVNKEADVMQDTLEKTVNTAQAAGEQATDRAQAVFGEMNERAKTAMEKSTKMVEDFNAFAKGNIEAMVESSRIAAKGAEDIAKYSADFGRKAIQNSNDTTKRFASVKSPTEFFELQSEVLKSSIDSFVTETSKFTESYLKLMGDVAQPISNRVAVAVEKAKVAA